MKKKYYSPKLDRSLISPLYHAAKAEGIPMTKLASRWVAEKLSSRDNVVREDPPCSSSVRRDN